MAMRYRSIDEKNFNISIALVGIYIAEVSYKCDYF